MPRYSPSNRTLLIAAVVLVVVTALALRFSTGPSQPSSLTPPPATQDSSGTIPSFTSARFQSGDTLGALGPEWTFLRQTDMTDSHAFVPLAGTRWVRETDVKLIGKETKLTMDEFTIMDASSLKESLANVQTTTIAGRDGYVVPIGDITGGTGFALVGQDSVLLIHDSDGGAWPTDILPEIQSFIGVANVL